MTSKHTTGPWVVGMDSEWSVDADGENSFVHIGPETGDPIAIAIVASPFDQDDLLEANARLIAAAPDMLEALRVLDANLAMHGFDTDGTMRSIALAAIAKAEGDE